jgi:hypothetical protein
MMFEFRSRLRDYCCAVPYYGFRYVQVETTAKVEDVAGEFLHADAPHVGSFATSNDLINRIHALIDAAVRSNLNHVLTDCPHREKLGWLEVAHLLGPSLMFNWDLRTYWPKVIRDIRDTQTNTGLFPTTAPEYARFGPLFRDSPEWGSAGVLLPLLAWQWYGDTAPMRESFDAMNAYVRYLGSRSKDGIVSYGLGDWYDIGPKPPGVLKLTPLGLTATAMYYADLEALRKMALALDRPAEAGALAQEAQRTAAAFHRRFYKDGSYATGSQTSLAMPLVLGLAPAAERKRLVAKLVADVKSRGNHPSAGDVGHRYLIAALMDAGRSDVLYDMTNQTQPPSYGAQIAAGATALTEAWDGDARSSQNHCMLGHIEEWFYGGLAGIRPDTDSPGLRHVRIEPQPVGDLRWVQASWNTFRGPIAVEWRRDDRLLRLTVDLPPGVTADIAVPSRSGSKAAKRVRVGSGRYEFESTDAP